MMQECPVGVTRDIDAGTFTQMALDPSGMSAIGAIVLEQETVETAAERAKHISKATTKKNHRLMIMMMVSMYKPINLRPGLLRL